MINTRMIPQCTSSSMSTLPVPPIRVALSLSSVTCSAVTCSDSSQRARACHDQYALRTISESTGLYRSISSLKNLAQPNHCLELTHGDTIRAIITIVRVLLGREIVATQAAQGLATHFWSELRNLTQTCVSLDQLSRCLVSQLRFQCACVSAAKHADEVVILLG